MGNQTSTSAFDPSHVRIYYNILSLKNPNTRVQMIQTCLSAPEYIISAKRAGVYSYLLSYVSAIQNGHSPMSLPGENQHTPQPQHALQAQQSASVPRYIQQVPPTGYSDRVQTQITTYREPPSDTPSWMQITQTPKQKMVSYFSSCLEVLGIQEEVSLTPDVLKQAYKKAAIRSHPDKGGSEEEFEAVTRAYAYLNEILRRIQGGRERAPGVVEAPTILDSTRKEEAKQWQHVEPVRLNPKNLDMNAFNKMFEQTHMPDPDQDGYGDWLKTEVGSATKAPTFGGKFNRDVFNSMFEQEARKNNQSARVQNSVIVHPEAMALLPTMGTEIGRGRPEDYTAAPNSRTQYTDLRSAYTTEATISDKISDVRVEERRFDTYRASREKAPDPYTDNERQQLYQSEQMLRQREELRQRRKAEQDTMENRYFERMKQLVITEK